MELLVEQLRDPKCKDYKFPPGEFDITLAEAQGATTGITRKFRLTARLHYALVFEDDAKKDAYSEQHGLARRVWPSAEQWDEYMFFGENLLPEAAEVWDAALEMADDCKDMVDDEEDEAEEDEEEEAEEDEGGVETGAAAAKSQDGAPTKKAKRAKKE